MQDAMPAKLNYFVRKQTFEGWKILPRVLADYELVLLLKGQGQIVIDDVQYTVEAGDLICFKPQVKHSLWVEQEPCMLFYGLHFEPLDPARSIPFPDVLHLDAPIRLTALFQKLHEVYYAKAYLYEWKQSLLLQQILCEILTVLHEQKEPMGMARVRRALEYIHEDPCREIQLEDLLKCAGIRKTEFIKAFRAMTGTTPIRYILDQRLETARDLLSTSELPVAMIAEKCGFSDPFYFSRCFGRRFGKSPRQYREQTWNGV